MLKKIILSLLITISFLKADFKEINEVQLQDMIKNNIVVIDIRRDEEFRRLGIIKGSIPITFFKKGGSYDIPAWMSEFAKYVKSKDQAFVLVCAHANRTKVVGEFLSNKLKYKNVYDLKGGIEYGWIDKKLKTIKYKN